MNLFFIVIFMFLGAVAEVDLKKEISSMKSLGVQSIDLESKSDLVLIDFWASWCEPCKESFPYYEAAIKKQKKKILFVSVNLDETSDKALAFLKEFPQSHITVWDEKKKLMGLLDFESIPHLLVLDSNWKTIEAIKGFNEKTKKKLKKYF